MNDFVLNIPENMLPHRLGQKSVWEKSARAVLALLGDVVGTEGLAEKAILHYGCGAKVSKLFLENDIAIKQYTGIDSNGELIAFLQSAVSDARFEYHHANIHNALYNRQGLELSHLHSLPVECRTFDLICLFSVFSHLAPHDYKPLLRLLRPHATDNARLVYTLFLNERTRGGYAMMDKWAPVIEEYGDIPADAVVPDFVDFFPDQPLRAAVYSRAYALELVRGSGWQVEEVRDPMRYLQHVFICRPA